MLSSALQHQHSWINAEQVSGLDQFDCPHNYLTAFLNAKPGTWKFPEIGALPWNEREYIRKEGKFHCQKLGCFYGHVLLSVLKYVK